MNFAFTDDQLLFRDAVAEFFANECPPEKVRWSWDDEVGRDASIWAALAEMGVIGLTVPEAFGGMGMNEIDLLPILTEAGRYAYPAPLVETVAVVAPLLTESAPAAIAEKWLPGIADGSVIATVQLDDQPFVNDMHIANLLIAQRGDQLFAIPAEHVRSTPQVSVDGARRLFSIEWDEADAELIVSGEAALEAANRAFDRGAAATAAQLIGLSEQMIARISSSKISAAVPGSEAKPASFRRKIYSRNGSPSRFAPSVTSSAVKPCMCICGTASFTALATSM